MGGAKISDTYPKYALFLSMTFSGHLVFLNTITVQTRIICFNQRCVTNLQKEDFYFMFLENNPYPFLVIYHTLKFGSISFKWADKNLWN